jgi:hypothetical protein
MLNKRYLEKARNLVGASTSCDEVKEDEAGKPPAVETKSTKDLTPTGTVDKAEEESIIIGADVTQAPTAEAPLEEENKDDAPGHERSAAPEELAPVSSNADSSQPLAESESETNPYVRARFSRPARCADTSFPDPEMSCGSTMTWMFSLESRRCSPTK